MSVVPVTVVVLTLNEESNVGGALESVAGWAREVFVVDSCSSDRTVDVALEHGAGIVQRPFTNYGDQWNWALTHLPIATPWVLKLDADERLSPELKDEIAAVIAGDPAEVAFRVRIRLWFLGRPIRAGIDAVRLWRTGKGRFSDVTVNEHFLADGPTGQLRRPIEHMDSPDLHRWVEKQNRYTTMEAIMRVRGDALAVAPRLFGSALERRMWLKKLFFRVPFRYKIQWVHEVVGRGVWRDGARGLAWAGLRVWVRRMIELKVREIRATGRMPEMPAAPRGGYDSRVLESTLQKRCCGTRER